MNDRILGATLTQLAAHTLECEQCDREIDSALEHEDLYAIDPLDLDLCLQGRILAARYLEMSECEDSEDDSEEEDDYAGH